MYIVYRTISNTQPKMGLQNIYKIFSVHFSYVFRLHFPMHKILSVRWIWLSTWCWPKVFFYVTHRPLVWKIWAHLSGMCLQMALSFIYQVDKHGFMTVRWHRRATRPCYSQILLYWSRMESSFNTDFSEYWEVTWSVRHAQSSSEPILICRPFICIFSSVILPIWVMNRFHADTCTWATVERAILCVVCIFWCSWYSCDSGISHGKFLGNWGSLTTMRIVLLRIKWLRKP